MSNQELYDIARQRVDRRNRRWTLWAINLGVLILSVALVVYNSETPYVQNNVGFMLVCAAVFVTHTIILGMTSSRDEDIEKEVEKLRDAVSAASYEKPKRMELTDDGEIVDVEDWTHDDAQNRLRS
jgi:hypothetical protein